MGAPAAPGKGARTVTHRILLSFVLLLLAPASAQAAACCVGSTSNFGGRLGPCEWAGGGVGLSGEAAFGHWSRAGSFKLMRADRSETARLTLGGMVRFDRVAQMAVTVPFLLQHRRIAGVDDLGGGPGDTVVTFRFEPMPERYGATAPPSVTFQLATSIPTGIPTEAVDGTARATGSGYLTLLPRVGLQRAFLKGSLAVELEVGFSLPRPGDEQVVLPGAPWMAMASASWFVNRKVTLGVSSGLRGLTPGFVGGRSVGPGSVSPWIALGPAFQIGPGRLTLGVSTGVPLPGLGSNEEARLGVSVGYTLVSRRPLSPRSPGS